jgi:hypothetical protein
LRVELLMEKQRTCRKRSRAFTWDISSELLARWLFSLQDTTEGSARHSEWVAKVYLKVGAALGFEQWTRSSRPQCERYLVCHQFGGVQYHRLLELHDPLVFPDANDRRRATDPCKPGPGIARQSRADRLQHQFYNFGGQGFGVGQQGSNITKVEGLPQNQTSAPILPNYLGLPFRIMVSPFVNYDPATRKTDIMMFNSSQLGAMVAKQGPQVMSWDDNRYGIQEMLWSASDPWRKRSWDAYQVPPPCGIARKTLAIAPPRAVRVPKWAETYAPYRINRATSLSTRQIRAKWSNR